MISSVNSTSGTSATPDANTSAAKNAEISKDAFLQLLVAQVKNQDPLKPTDGVEFLTQLAQFTQLEQTIGMRSDLSTLAAELKPKVTSSDATTQATDNQTTSGATHV